MATERELLDPVAGWFRSRFGGKYRVLVHEEPQGRGSRRVDMLVVLARWGEEQVDRVLVIAVEIEVSSKAALHDRRNGVQQLAKYPGHLRYLAIPRTVAVRPEARDIPHRCERRGFGLLVVDIPTGRVDCVIEAERQTPPHALRFYRKAMERWTRFRDTSHAYRRISHQVILDEDSGE